MLVSLYVLQACFKFMSHLLREKQFIALGDSWAAPGDEEGGVGKEERVGILRGGQLRVRAFTRKFLAADEYELTKMVQVLLSFVRADMEDAQKQVRFVCVFNVWTLTVLRRAPLSLCSRPFSHAR